MKKIDRLACIASAIVEIVHWLIGVYMLVIVFLMLLARDVMLEAFANDGEGLIARLSINNMVVNADQLGANHFYTAVIVTCLLSVISAVLMALIFRDVRKLLKQSFAETPFQPAVINRLQRVATLAMTLPVINLLGHAIGSLLTEGVISLNFDLSGFIMGVLALALVRVFRYGAQLQNDVDGLV